MGCTMHLRLRQIPGIKLKQRFSLAARVRFAQIMGLEENKFSVFVKDVENGPIFAKLMYPPEKNQKIIEYKRFPGASFAGNAVELLENVSREESCFDAESLVSEKKEAAQIIRALGREQFERLFLYNEEGHSINEIIAITGLSRESVEKINHIINEMSIYGEFHPIDRINISGIYCHKVAIVGKNNEGGFDICFTTPKFAQGKYSIDYKRLTELKKSHIWSKEEQKNINELVNNLELINARRTTVYQVLNHIVEKQKGYFVSGDERHLVPFSQKEMAVAIGVDPSLISRAVYGKSIETPQGTEHPLIFFLPSPKDVRKNIIREIAQTDPRALSDREIRDILKEKYNITTSRRTVAVCREEMGINRYANKKSQ